MLPHGSGKRHRKARSFGPEYDVEPVIVHAAPPQPPAAAASGKRQRKARSFGPDYHVEPVVRAAPPHRAPAPVYVAPRPRVVVAPGPLTLCLRARPKVMKTVQVTKQAAWKRTPDGRVLRKPEPYYHFCSDEWKYPEGWNRGGIMKPFRHKAKRLFTRHKYGRAGRPPKAPEGFTKPVAKKVAKPALAAAAAAAPTVAASGYGPKHVFGPKVICNYVSWGNRCTAKAVDGDFCKAHGR